MEFATTDLCDEYDDLHIADPVFTNFGSVDPFAGPIATVKVHEDNVLVRQALETSGDGRVLVVDGGGSLRCALVGDLLISLALENGWVGILVNGAVRDVGQIRTIGLPLRALATRPNKSVKNGFGQVEVPVRFAGAVFTPGAWLYADDDGIVVADGPRHLSSP